MSAEEISSAALDLPPEERLELARRLVESVVEPASLKEAVVEGIRRIEDIATGRVQGLIGLGWMARAFRREDEAPATH